MMKKLGEEWIGRRNKEEAQIGKGKGRRDLQM